MGVNILSYLNKDGILINLKGNSKKNILSYFLDHLISTGKIDKDNKKEILKVLVQREQMGSTAIGGGIALPHARIECVKDIVLCVGISKEGVNFDSLDEGPVYVAALLLSHQKEAGLHLKILALLARILRDKYFVEEARQVDSAAKFISLLKRQYSLVK